MWASAYGHHDIVRTLIEAEADVNAKDNVRNQMMIMMMIIVLLTILMMMIVVINDEDRDVCR
jgi:ankyrin repeat protein